MGVIARAAAAAIAVMMMAGAHARASAAMKPSVNREAAVRQSGAPMRLRRLDTVALMERMRSRIDWREAGILNAFIAFGIVSKAVVKTPKRLPIPLLTIPDSIPSPSTKRNSVWQSLRLCHYVCSLHVSVEKRLRSGIKKARSIRAITVARRDSQILSEIVSTAKLGNNFGMCNDMDELFLIFFLHFINFKYFCSDSFYPLLNFILIHFVKRQDRRHNVYPRIIINSK